MIQIKRKFWLTILISFLMTLSGVIVSPVTVVHHFFFAPFSGVAEMSIAPVQAQGLLHLKLPFVHSLPQPQQSQTSACIYLDGRCIFELSTLDSESLERITEIQSRLDDVSMRYLRQNLDEITITQETAQSLPNIYIQIPNEPKIRLLTITHPDAELKGVPLEVRGTQLVEILTDRLKQAKDERSVESLSSQGAIALGIFLILFLANRLVVRQIKKIQESKQEYKPTTTSNNGNKVISTLLLNRQKWNFKEVQLRSLQLLQLVGVGGGIVILLGLFPYTRMVRLITIVLLQYPLRIGMVGLGTYLLIRFSYGLIAQFNSIFTLNHLIPGEANRRLQLRMNTISVVIQSIVTGLLLTVGVFVALATVGINITPLLAGAGIIGLGISLASQNLLKDIINGFCIIVEDQYAVGDVINVGEYGGLVEYMNLRITQLRDAEGRLITIPNGEVTIVANHSNNWSRADLNIPISYSADLNQALEIIKAVANQMNHEPDWKDKIVEEPSLLGVDQFSDRGLMIKLWIKTEPLKQWEVAREYRRRLKLALDEAQIPIPLPQQEIWFQSQSPQARKP